MVCWSPLENRKRGGAVDRAERCTGSFGEVGKHVSNLTSSNIVAAILDGVDAHMS